MIIKIIIKKIYINQHIHIVNTAKNKFIMQDSKLKSYKITYKNKLNI